MIFLAFVLCGAAAAVAAAAAAGGEGGGRFVTRAKKRRSAFSGGQGKVPRRPMPRVGVVATMRVRGGRGRGGIVGGEVMVVVVVVVVVVEAVEMEAEGAVDMLVMILYLMVGGWRGKEGNDLRTRGERWMVGREQTRRVVLPLRVGDCGILIVVLGSMRGLVEDTGQAGLVRMQCL